MRVDKKFFVYTLLLILGVAGAFYMAGVDAWKIWNIPTLQPVFIDARIITASSESYSLGFDPEIENPRDPFGRLFNLPVAWKLLFLTGIDQDQTNLFAGFLIVSFYLGLLIFADRSGNFAVWVLALLAFFPPVALALERGNVDLFIFFLCSLSLAFVNKNIIASLLVLWFAGILKIYPVFGILFILHLERKSFQKYISIFFVAFGLYALLTIENFRHTLTNTEVGSDISYGLNVLPLYIDQASHNNAYYIISGLLSFFIVLIIVILSLFWMNYLEERIDVSHTPYLSAFRLGSGIYIATFLLGNNWDYRLIFLLFTLPQLMVWLKQSRIAIYTLSAIIISFSYLWFSLFLPFAYFLDEFANWLVFAGLLYLMVTSLPDWVKNEIHIIFERYNRRTK